MSGLKKNATREAWVGALVASALLVGWAQLAHAAEPRVLLLEADGPPSGFLSALQIQLVGLATPERRLQPQAANAAQQIESAVALARAEGALAAIWVEPSHPPILYVVGEREGRALVEVVRGPGGRGPEFDRTLALKVREIVAELRRSQASAPAEAMLLQPAVPEIAKPPQPSAAAAPAMATVPSWRGVVLLAGRLGSQPRIGLARWGVGAGLGPVVALDALRLAAVVGVDWFPQVSTEFAGEQARFSELAGTLTLHAQRRAGRSWLGVQTGPQRVWLNASGTTAAQVSGPPRTDPLWAWVAGLSAEVPIGAGFGFAAEVQLQALLQRQHLTVNKRELVDFGVVRARFAVALTLRPFGE